MYVCKLLPLHILNLLISYLYISYIVTYIMYEYHMYMYIHMINLGGGGNTLLPLYHTVEYVLYHSNYICII